MSKINFTQEQIDKIIDLYINQKIGQKKIGEIMGVSMTPIRRILQENNVQIRDHHHKDYTGQRFGKLVVIGLDPDYIPAPGRHAKWICQCDCGNQVSVASNHLTDRENPACSVGCKNRIEPGTVFGRLTVLEMTDKRHPKNGAMIYKCQCDCGELILVSSTELRANRKSSCKKCNESAGEATIRKILEKNSILFEQQKSFKNCINPETHHRLYFDFYVNNSYLIEFDGIQHEMSIEHWDGEEGYKKRQQRDKIKNEYAKKNNIPLIRIPYTQLNNICLEDLQLETSSYLI